MHFSFWEIYGRGYIFFETGAWNNSESTYEIDARLSHPSSSKAGIYERHRADEKCRLRHRSQTNFSATEKLCCEGEMYKLAAVKGVKQKFMK